MISCIAGLQVYSKEHQRKKTTQRTCLHLASLHTHLSDRHSHWHKSIHGTDVIEYEFPKTKGSIHGDVPKAIDV